jgi:hypothetical protein
MAPMVARDWIAGQARNDDICTRYDDVRARNPNLDFRAMRPIIVRKEIHEGVPMNKTIGILGLGLALLLAGCGGSGDAGQSIDATPAAAVATLRAQAQLIATTSAVTPQQAAEQLMNFAEATFPQFFPGHKTTATLNPFVYRFYGETGSYLGVVVIDASGYAVNGVYVMGGVFGSAPSYVGPLTAFITPTATSGDNGCSNLALFDTQGTHSVITYQQTGNPSGTSTMEITVGGLVSVQGVQTRESDTLTTSTLTLNGGSYSGTTAIKSFQSYDGGGTFTNYEDLLVATSSFNGAASGVQTSTTTFAPPWVNSQFALQAGQTETDTISSTVVSGLQLPGLPDQISSFSGTSTSTIKYVGRETITVPAGTYEACRFDRTTSPQLPVASMWYMAGQGLLIQSGTIATANYMRATSIVLNGQRL